MIYVIRRISGWGLLGENTFNTPDKLNELRLRWDIRYSLYGHDGLAWQDDHENEVWEDVPRQRIWLWDQGPVALNLYLNTYHLIIHIKDSTHSIPIRSWGLGKLGDAVCRGREREGRLPGGQWRTSHSTSGRSSPAGGSGQLGRGLCQAGTGDIVAQMEMINVFFSWKCARITRWHGRAGLPGVYTNVGALRTWIDETIQENGGGNFCQ